MKKVILQLTLIPSILFAQRNAVESSVLLRPLDSDDSFSGGLTGSLTSQYDSRYFTEGRDELDGDAIIATAFELAYEEFAFGTWYGVSPEQNYDELQFSLAYTGTLGDFEYYLSWTYLQFSTLFPGNDQDNEVGFGISYGGLPYDIGLAVDAAYSLEADGTFIELSLDKSFELTDQFSLGFSSVFGINQNFVSDGHDGANHLAFSTSLNYSPIENLTFSLHATQSLSLDRDPSNPGDETLIDFFHIGAGFQFSF